ncbi:MAG TPA: thermonuclease family protein [Solirubrobacteraceae bacterium]|nr:thermonuclease family protein [Solirubrobacteraceae bacterium]
MRRPVALGWTLAFVALAGFAGTDLLRELGSGVPERDGRVVHVVDGDTIAVRLGGREETVRYIGVDTPETKRPGAPVQCFGPAAGAFNARLVEGERVRVEPGEEQRDRYGRLLGYVYRERDGLFVNEALVRGGYARARAYAPNDRYAARFDALTDAAREGGRGLWGRC